MERTIDYLSELTKNPKVRTPRDELAQFFSVDRDPVLGTLFILVSDKNRFVDRLSSELQTGSNDWQRKFSFSPLVGVLDGVFTGWARASIILTITSWEEVRVVEIDHTVSAQDERAE